MAEVSCCAGPNEVLRAILLTLNDIESLGGNAIEVDDEGIPLTLTLESLNFVGGGVTASVVGNNVTVTIPNIGDVVGPAGAVDDRIATFDGVTGKLIQDSGVLISSVVTNTTLQAGSQVIGSGVDTIAVVFPTPFAVAPVVVATMSRPVAENLIDLNIDEASITTTGFTASLGSTTASANYRLKWMAK